ncbi:DUF4870 family protein [Xylophilus sp.]|uniref:DUF4870 family protein n=1 Tax=Xylophilus sp. TaxID=2653893 RepID=UPI0013BE41B8|nr:hypothetical protein [Xylophilus sp.]KAF1045717.1 MAG: hypothetical protein GAK38_02853 [Xylophilus sp.]
MNGSIEPARLPPPDDSLVAIGWVSYVLHFIVAVAVVIPSAQPSLVLLLIALIIDLVKRDDAAGTWQSSHFRWRIRSVLWAAVLYIVTAPLWLLFFVPGWIAWSLISLWFLYRIIKGMVRMNRRLPLEPADAAAI